MAFDSAEDIQRYNPSGIWRMDHLETSQRSDPKRVSVDDRLLAHGSSSKIGHYQDIVRAWLILLIFSASAPAAVIQVFFWGHW